MRTRIFILSASLFVVPCRSEPIQELDLFFVPVDGLSGQVMSIEFPQGLFRLLLDYEPWKPVQESYERTHNPQLHFLSDDSAPVANITPVEVQQLCDKLTSSSTVWKYRIPTEEEWEVAASDDYPVPADATLNDFAWIHVQSPQCFRLCGKKEPNRNGLYDCIGNVSEITASTNSDIFFAKGGDYASPDRYLNTTNRFALKPNETYACIGFRLIRFRKQYDHHIDSQQSVDECAEKNAAANELFSLPELPEGVVADLARMFKSTDEDEVWRDYCLQFLGSALERTDGVTDEDRALARETLVEALASTNATFAGTALRALHRGAPADPLVPSSALRIARDPSYPSASRTTALLILEECSSLGADGEAVTPEERRSVLRETAASLSADPSASSLLRQTAEAVLKRHADD